MPILRVILPVRMELPFRLLASQPIKRLIASETNPLFVQHKETLVRAIGLIVIVGLDSVQSGIGINSGRPLYTRADRVE
jgi:hypothetical protein